MHIIAHRGYWKTLEEQNTIKSIGKAFENGFGIETDIRDYCGELVVSHNIATDKAETAEALFELYQSSGASQMLALNVKADGIQTLLMPLLEKFGIHNYFLFDMSIPELIVNQKMNLRFFTRQSDVESECVQYAEADGVWLDSFFDEDFITENHIALHLKNYKKVCIVSPELHGRDSHSLWVKLKEWNLTCKEQLYLCTDKPEEARRFFE